MSNRSHRSVGRPPSYKEASMRGVEQHIPKSQYKGDKTLMTLDEPEECRDSNEDRDTSYDNEVDQEQTQAKATSTPSLKTKGS